MGSLKARNPDAAHIFSRDKEALVCRASRPTQIEQYTLVMRLCRDGYSVHENTLYSTSSPPHRCIYATQFHNPLHPYLMSSRGDEKCNDKSLVLPFFIFYFFFQKRDPLMGAL